MKNTREDHYLSKEGFEKLQKELEWLRLSMATLMDMAPYVIAAGYMAVRAPEAVTISVTVAVAAAKAVVDKRSRDQRNG